MPSISARIAYSIFRASHSLISGVSYTRDYARSALLRFVRLYIRPCGRPPRNRVLNRGRQAGLLATNHFSPSCRIFWFVREPLLRISKLATRHKYIFSRSVCEADWSSSCTLHENLRVSEPVNPQSDCHKFQRTDLRCLRYTLNSAFSMARS